MNLQQASLADDVLTIRPWSLDDVPALTEALQDREISRWIPVIPFPYSERDAREYIERTIAPKEEPEAVGYAIKALDGAALLGQIGLSSIDLRNKTGEVGYWIVSEHRGRGIALRAVRLVSDWVFDQAGLERLELRTLDGNTASERVAIKAGFTREGVLRSIYEVGGRRRDLAVWSLLRSERGTT